MNQIAQTEAELRAAMDGLRDARTERKRCAPISSGCTPTAERGEAIAASPSLLSRRRLSPPPR